MGEGLPARVRRGYALGSVATGSFATVPGLLLLPYLTDRLGISAAIAGLIVFLPKAWDVVLNPIAGRISDRSNSPTGRRRPFLIRAGIALAAFFVLLFAGPAQPPWLAGAWVVVAFLACATAYAFFQVPYLAMAAEMTDDYAERTRIMSWRVAILALAILLSGGLSPLVRDAVGPQWGYLAVGIFVAALIAIGAVGAWRGTRAAPVGSLAEAGGSLLSQLAVVARAANFKALLTAFVLQALASGAMLAGVDYVARTVLASPGAATALFLAFVAPALLTTPLWQRLGARLGKKAGFVVASLVFAAGALAALAMLSVSTIALVACVAVIGVGYAGAQLFPLAMLPDIAAVDTASTGENRAGVYTGVWTAVETLGLALGPLLYAGVLAAGGYVSSTTGEVAQPVSALTAIGLGFTLLPAVLVLASLLPLRRYHLDQDAVRAATEGVR